MKRPPLSPATTTQEILAVEAATVARNDKEISHHTPSSGARAFLHERGHIARDLHDCVLQSLYAIGLSIETARRMSPDLPPEAARSTTQAVEQLNDLIRVVRGMIQNLETGTEPTFDFLSELRTLVKTYEAVGQLAITMNFPTDVPEGVTQEVERELAHIAREALSNCVRHAGATQVTLSLDVQGASIRLTVCDNGKGFNLEGRQSSGYGLSNMADRARERGGSLEVSSRIGNGTWVCAEFVLEPALAAR